MSGALFILAINISVAGILAAAFAAVALQDANRISARWFVTSYLLGMAFFILEFVLPLSGGHIAVSTLGYMSFAGALAAFAVGLSCLYERPIPWPALAALGVAALTVKLVTDTMPRDSFTRLLLYQLPYFALQAVGAWIIFRASHRSRLDNALCALVSLSALHYLSKPLAARGLGGVGADAQSYVTTAYAMFSQTLGTVLALAMAVLLLIILVRGVFADMLTRSLTDKLSGLLNRRGFEERCEAALRAKMLNGLPLSMVICDLDHFKDINDTFGHATGDRVITVFAELLREVVADHQVAARIGGEEFAILLPGANLAAARLFAENVRNAFASFEILGLPPERRFTASFGAAECAHGERAVELLARADEALYEAKRAGRDCVRTAPLRAAPFLYPGNGPSRRV